MSVETISNKCEYDTDGSTKVWDYTFPIISSTDIEVYVVDPAGTSTKITTNFSVNTSAAQVTYPVVGDPLANDGSKVILLRVVPINQELALTTQGPFPATSLNSAYDKLTMVAQQLQEQIDRLFIAPVGSETSADLLTALNSAVSEAQASASEALVYESGALSAEAAAQVSASYAQAAAATFTKATTTEAQAGVEDTHYMTPSKTSAAITALQRALATVTEAQAGASNLVDMSPLRTAQAITALATGKFFVGLLSRDLSAVTGSVAYAGVGFTPKAIIFFAGKTSSVYTFSSGAYTNGVNYAVSVRDSTAGVENDSACISLNASGPSGQSAIVSLLGADGFTLAWTKVGSPTGNAQVVYMAIG